MWTSGVSESHEKRLSNKFSVIFVFKKDCNSKRSGIFLSGQESATPRGKKSKEKKANVTLLQKGAGFKHELVSDFIKTELPIT